MLECERCGRKGVESIRSCPFHNAGDCIYLTSKEKLYPLLGLIVLFIAVIGLVLFLIGGITFLIDGKNVGLIVSLLCFFPLIFSSILAILTGIILIFGIRERLDHAPSGASLQKVWFLGFDLYQFTKSAVEPLKFRFQVYSAVRYPPSVIAVHLHPPEITPRSIIYWNQYAAEILITSIAYLLVTDCLSGFSCHTQRTFLGGRIKGNPQKQYFFATGAQLGSNEAGGQLEQRILDVVENGSKRKASSDGAYGISPYQLAILLIGSSRWNPGRWIYQQVKQEIETLELPSPNGTINTIQKDGNQLESILENIRKSHPDFIETLRSALRSGLTQMEWKYEGEP